MGFSRLLSLGALWLFVMPTLEETSVSTTYKDPSIIVADTIAELRRATLFAGRQLAHVCGTLATYDGLGLLYRYDSTSSTADDGINVIRPTSIEASATGRWRLISVSGGGTSSSPPIIVDTVSDLRAVVSSSTRAFAATRGQLTKYDGNHGIYLFDSASSVADDGFNYVKPDDTDAGDPGRWVRFYP